jgi:hypothetical protein
MNYTSFEKFKAFDISTLLKTLVKESSKPTVKIFLTDNIRLQGIILAISEKDMMGLSVCFHNSRTNSVAYFQAAQIITIEILYPHRLSVVLSNGEIPRSINEEETISQLQLKRWIKDQIERLVVKNENLTVYLPEVELSDTDRLNIRDVVGIMVEVINATSSDKLGEEAWCKILSVYLKHSTKKIEVIRADNNITLGIEYKKALEKGFAIQLENALLEKL